jgi:hypothetical protein
MTNRKNPTRKIIPAVAVNNGAFNEASSIAPSITTTSIAIFIFTLQQRSFDFPIAPLLTPGVFQKGKSRPASIVANKPVPALVLYFAR